VFKLFVLFIFSVVVFAKEIIGIHEYINFEDLDSTKFIAKIDTGAKTSSMHIEDIKVIDDKNIQIKITPKSAWKNFKISRITHVKSSNGISHQRYYIFTFVKIGNKSYNLEFNLNNRSNMKYPVLLGRNFLENRFLVDVSKEYLLNFDEQ